MAARDGLVYDEDDYLPPGYVPPKRPGGRTRSLVALTVLGVIVGTFVVVFMLRTRERARFARGEWARSAQNATLASNRLGAERMGGIGGPPGNWDRIVGVWSRTPEPEERDRPIRFEIRKGRTAAVTYIDENGETVAREWEIDEIDDFGEGITLGMQGPMGSILQRYRFLFVPDGSILLEDQQTGDLQFKPER
jgi:hypothetical protein